MTVIALRGIKGGTGTTSVVSGVAWALQRLGNSVLVIDFSPDNLLRLCFNMPFEQTRGWARSSIDGTPWQESALRYTPLLDFIPFGTTTTTEKQGIEAHLAQHPDFWQQKIAALSASNHYNFILLDLPAQDSISVDYGLSAANHVVYLLNLDMSCHVRLHQQEFQEACYFLVNKFSSACLLQNNLLQLWQHTLPNLIPQLIHQDEAVAEAYAVKQPPGEYSMGSLATQDLVKLAQWCLTDLLDKRE